MKTIVVDDEVRAMNVFLYEAENIPELEIVGMFQTAREALAYISEHPVELAILDVQIGCEDGITLGRQLKEKMPDIVLIYITAHEQYAIDAYRLRAAAYIMKPYSEEELRYAVEAAYLLSKRHKKRIFARTFGYFDLFVDGEPIMFKSAKAKELLAFLIDRRGGTVNTDQIISVLWEDRPNDEATQNLCSKAVRTLQKELKKYHAEEILVLSRGIRRIDPQKFDCDLYTLLEKGPSADNWFGGEYLQDYSWAEAHMASLYKYMTPRQSDKK